MLVKFLRNCKNDFSNSFIKKLIVSIIQGLHLVEISYGCPDLDTTGCLVMEQDQTGLPQHQLGRGMLTPLTMIY